MGNCCCEKDNHCHHHKHCCNNHDNNNNDRADLKDFEFYTLNPNVEQDNLMELTENVQTPVASVTLDEVNSGDLVWLNGVFGLDNDANTKRFVTMRIYKGSPPMIVPGQEIYRAVFDIDDAGDDDNVVEPLAHVDVIAQNDSNVTYTVTIEPDGSDVFLNGPVTFTAALIRK